MARKPLRDLTMEEQLARGPLDLPFLMLVLMLLGIGLIMLFSASYYTAFRDSKPPVNNNPYFYIIRQAAFAAAGLVVMYITVSFTHLRAHETGRNVVCRLLLEKKKKNND